LQKSVKESWCTKKREREREERTHRGEGVVVVLYNGVGGRAAGRGCVVLQVGPVTPPPPGRQASESPEGSHLGDAANAMMQVGPFGMPCVCLEIPVDLSTPFCKAAGCPPLSVSLASCRAKARGGPNSSTTLEQCSLHIHCCIAGGGFNNVVSSKGSFRPSDDMSLLYPTLNSTATLVHSLL
jgi:hypothetical protein